MPEALTVHLEKNNRTINSALYITYPFQIVWLTSSICKSNLLMFIQSCPTNDQTQATNEQAE